MLDRLKRAVSLHSRERKVREFFSMCPEGACVLDVGVSGQVRDNDAELNYFLARYPRDPSTYTGLGIDEMMDLQSRYPRFRLVQYDGGLMPFEPCEFEWVFSNAVIEHVGDAAAQLFFINEMLRVAKSVYFTTPNRWFPVETHSSKLFRHWHRGLFDRWAARNGYSWLTSRELRLLGYRDLLELMRKSTARDFQIRKNWIPGVPWPMTFSVIARN